MNTIGRVFDTLDTTDLTHSRVALRAGTFLTLSLLMIFSTLYVPTLFTLITIPLGLYLALGATISLADLNLRNEES